MRRLAAGALAAMALLGGCGKGGGTSSADSPQALFDLFDAAMKAGRFEQAAALVDYEAQANKANPDVDTGAGKFGQKQITDKMREATTAGLKSLGYPSDGMKAAAPVVTGATATVSATGGGKSITLQMANGGEGWKIVGGVPGMTSEGG
jgi:hypothetical protein